MSLVLGAAGSAIATPVTAEAACDIACATSNLPNTPQSAAAELMGYVRSGQLKQATITTGSIFNDEIAPIADNSLTNPTCRVDKRTMQTLIAIIKYTGSAVVTDLNRHCANDGAHVCPSSSPHCTLTTDSDGLLSSTAMDIGATGDGPIDGYNNFATVNLRTLIKALVPRVTATGFSSSGADMGQSNCSTAALDSPYFWPFSDTCNHQHADYRGNSTALNVSTGGSPSTESGPASIVRIGADGTLLAKTGMTGSWVTLLGDVADVAVATDQAGTPVIAALTTGGLVRTKVGLNGTWLTQIGDVRSVAVSTQPSGTTLAVVRTDGTLQAKVGLESGWTTLGGGVSQVSIATDRVNAPTITALYSDGTLRAKTGIQGPWVGLADGVARVDTTADTTNGPSWSVVQTDGVVRGKVGMNGSWVALTSPSTDTRLASDPVHGLTILETAANGSLFGKTGLYGGWVGLLDGVTSFDIATSGTNGPTIVAVANGTLYAKSGLGGNWIVLGSASKVVIAN